MQMDKQTAARKNESRTVNRSVVEKIVMTTGDLPAMPHVANLAMQRLSDPEVSAGELHEIISRDQALAARLLRIANSSCYSRRREIKTINEAVVIIGFNTIKSIVISCAMHDFFKSFGLAEKYIWEHSLGNALICRTIAKKIKYPKMEEAFLAGLLHDVGKVVLYIKLPQKMLLIFQEVYQNPQLSFGALEKKLLGFTHAQVGGLVARKWNFAVDIVEAIGYHHHPDHAKLNTVLPHIVALGDALSHKLGIGFVKRPDINLSAMSSTRVLRLDGLALSDLSEEIEEVFASEKGVFV